MVVGGANGLNDVEVINLEDENSVCTKPKNIPLHGYSVGAFMNGTVYVCGDNSVPDCYFYDQIQGKWRQM